MAKRKKAHGSLDTNILLRLLLRDVPAQTDAVELLLATGKTFEIASAAIIELVFALEKLYRMDRELIHENVRTLVSNKQLLCETKLFLTCMPLYVAQPSLSIVDCALLTHARLNKAIPLYTFDKDLIKHSGDDARAPATKQ